MVGKYTYIEITKIRIQINLILNEKNSGKSLCTFDDNIV